MIINHNIPALNTLRQLNSNSNAASTSLERLSSGLRINSAADDAAGLAISEKMKTQIRGLDQASRNAQDGISLIQTAEGALEETESILQRMRELAVQATNDTNTDDDRTEIQAEIDQLISEIDRISTTTEFNTKKLLNGNVASTATVSGTNTANIDSAVVEDAILDSGTYTLSVSGTANQEIADVVDAGTGLSSATITVGDAAVAEYGSYQLKVTEDTDNAGMYVLSLVDATTGDEVASQNNVTIGAAGTVTLNGLSFDTSVIAGEGTVTFDVEGDHTFTLTDSAGTTIATVTATDLNKSEIDIKGLTLSFNYDITDSGAGTTTITVVNNSLTLQIGANSGQTMKVAINDMGSIALGIDELDVSTADGAMDAIDSIDDAVALVSHERAKLGAYQNRLEHTINNLGTSSENLSSAQSNIADVDMAKEQVEYTKESILVQSATAMLAQANAQPQNVLSLLSQ